MSMKKIARVVSVLALLWCVSAVAQEAAEEAPAADAPKTDAAATAADAQAQPPKELTDFVENFDSYKATLKELRGLKSEYQNATPERRDEILDKYKPLVAEAEKMQKLLIPQGIDAYNALEGKNVDLQNFLLGMFEWQIIKKENYESAFQIAEALIPRNGFPLPDYAYLYAYAAFAAFNTMHLEQAKQWNAIAKENKAYDKIRQLDAKDNMKISFALDQELPEYERLWEKEKEIRDKEAADDTNPRVVLHTTKGDITLELFPNEAPQAVGNFMTLVKDGFYTDVPFHRVLPFFMAQGGDPTGTGTGGPGYCIRCECTRPNARMHFRGSISMAHAGRNTGGSQFFLTFVPTGFLNGKHTVFGRIIDGMEVLSELQRIDPEGENLPAPDKIVSAEILRGEPTSFEKLPAR